jgi:hypothetical protein
LTVAVPAVNENCRRFVERLERELLPIMGELALGALGIWRCGLWKR